MLIELVGKIRALGKIDSKLKGFVLVLKLESQLYTVQVKCIDSFSNKRKPGSCQSIHFLSMQQQLTVISEYVILLSISSLCSDISTCFVIHMQWLSKQQ